MKRVIKIWVITLFPEYFKPLRECGVVGQALSGQRGQQIELHTLQLRDFCSDGYKGVDSAPYGGGPGMVMRADVLKKALFEGVIAPGGYGESYKESLRVIFTTPRGRVWNHQTCVDFASRHWEQGRHHDLVFICGRYEGVDERFIEAYVDEVFSVGDYVLSGGEIAVMAMIDSALRFMPQVLGNRQSAKEESFVEGLLEHPHYTKPAEFEGQKIPEVLLSGHHKNIQEYRVKEAKRLTRLWRPDLLSETFKGSEK